MALRITHVVGVELDESKKQEIEAWAKRTLEEALNGEIHVLIRDYDYQNMEVAIQLPKTMIERARNTPFGGDV
jgi:hypothetical protein